jgi:hypothetical protein
LALMAALNVTLAEPDPGDAVAAGEATRDASSAAVAIDMSVLRFISLAPWRGPPVHTSIVGRRTAAESDERADAANKRTNGAR